MLNSELAALPSGSRILVESIDDRSLRFLHWLGYFPERIDGPRQTLVKTLSPGFVLQAPATEQAAFLTALGQQPPARALDGRTLAGALVGLALVLALGLSLVRA